MHGLDEITHRPGAGYQVFDQEILLLYPSPIVPEPLVTGSPMFPVAVKGGAEDGIGRVQPDAALKTAEGLAREKIVIPDE